MKVAVGIGTCYGKGQLIESVTSLREKQGIDCELTVVADRFPLDKDTKKQLKALGAKVRENKVEGSYLVKLLPAIRSSDSDLFVMSQDDIKYSPNWLKYIVEAFEKDKNLTFAALPNIPLTPMGMFEAGANVGTRLNNRMGKMWRNGDNYLAVLGRIMVFRTNWLKKIHMEDAVSLDAYYYLENKKMGGKYKCLWNIPLYFRNPQNWQEQLRKSSRFQNSYYEMKSYGRFDNLEEEYRVPLRIIIKAAVIEFISYPRDFLIYCGIFLMTRILKQKPNSCLIANWQVDLSTKNFYDSSGLPPQNKTQAVYQDNKAWQMY